MPDRIQRVWRIITLIGCVVLGLCVSLGQLVLVPYVPPQDKLSPHESEVTE